MIRIRPDPNCFSIFHPQILLKVKKKLFKVHMKFLNFLKRKLLFVTGTYCTYGTVPVRYVFTF